MTDRIPIPELPMLEEPVGSVDYRLRAAGRAEAGTAYTIAGRRAHLVGDERLGIAEVRAHGLRLAAGPRVAGGVAEAITVTPLGVERRVRMDGMPVLERAVVPRDLPACMVEWQAMGRVARLAVEWTAELERDGQETGAAGAPLEWRRTSRGAVVARAGSAADRVVFVLSHAPDAFEVECPAPVGPVRFRAALTIQPRGSVRLLVVGGVEEAELPRVLRAADRGGVMVQARRAATERRHVERLSLRSSDPAVEQALEWAKLRIDSYLAEIPGGGVLPVAGYGSGNPGAADTGRWCNAALALGDFESVAGVLAALGRQTTPASAPEAIAYLRITARYLAWTGDLAGIQTEWGRVLRAYETLRSAPAPGSPVDAAARAEVVEGLVHAAEAIGDPGAAVEFRRHAARSGVAPVDAAAGSGVDWRRLFHGAFGGGRGSWAMDSCPDHADATAAAVLELVDGLLGPEPDAPRGRLVLRPRPPAGWTRYEVKGLRLGEASLRMGYRREAGGHRFRVAQERGMAPLNLVLEPEVEGRLRSASVDGVDAALDAVVVGARTRVPVQLVLDHERTVLLATEPGGLVGRPGSE